MDSEKDIKCDQIQDNETWNTCPECGHEWKDEVDIPGLIHRIRLCEVCRLEKDNGPNGTKLH